MQKLKFANDEEREKCSKYLDLKGIAYHVVLINNIGLDKNGEITYKKISDLYKYDKRLRNRLYKFISAFEEQIRGFIANRYSAGLDSSLLGTKVNELLDSGSYITIALEELSFSELMNVVKELSEKDLNKLFPNVDQYLFKNLDAVRELRNAISHNKIILFYEEFESCYIDGIEKKDLASNIKNLSNLIDEYYKQFLIDSINDAVNDKRDKEFYVPKNFMVKI